MSTTVRDLIKGSLRLIGAIASGETPRADEQADALFVLNDMIESWSTEGLVLRRNTRETYTATGGVQTFTMGTGGNFNTTRPIALERAAVMQNDIEVPLEILNIDEWADIANKSQTSTYPIKIYEDNNFPLNNVSLWPIPSANVQLVLYSWKPLSRFSSVNDTIQLPPGFQRALRYNLAVELAPEYEKSAAAEVVAIASESKANIKKTNTKPIYMDAQIFGPSGGYDIELE